MRNTLIVVLLVGAPVVSLGAPASETEQPRAENDPPAIHTTVIRPKASARCQSADCDTLDRLPEEQLERLRALDNQYPGQIIQFAPQRATPGDQRH